MSDAVWIALIGNLATLIAVVFSRWLSYRDHLTTKDEIAVVKEDVSKIEKATNSMKDALVASTDREAFARGVKSETDKGTRGNS